MTSDAKIGLLLGLVFIFIIAFIINGLPSFRSKTSSNELTTNMTTLENGPPGIGTKERKTQETLDWMELAKKQPESSVPAFADRQNVSSTVPLPAISSKDADSNTSIGIETKKALVYSSPLTTQETEINTLKPIKPIWPKIYVVSENDSLASIAKKVYGSEEGKKKINIDRIFEANRRLLKSPDEIYIGQKLIIPAPSNLAVDKAKIDNVFSSKLFEKVESIGRPASVDSVDNSAKQSRWYVVRQGDSLWKIAAEQLGNGNRYSEINELNSDILNNEDNLVIGMRLKLPAR